ncbi:DNA-binding MarR family transcriptional regulator [Metabacillus malikii]|uniref:DNA-binding MarR family transcriptional regulator n=1 Tax=Metabacillus malikii TaxID=1504265 RepID=A0ABT9ZLR3_9BACI|nr:DNA-binding MarR family transcriptional regulator [Metabacillus malikii]
MVKQVPGKDKREKVIQITEFGEEIYQQCREKITELESKVMEGISLDEQQTAYQVLPKIQNNLISRKGNNRD